MTEKIPAFSEAHMNIYTFTLQLPCLCFLLLRQVRSTVTGKPVLWTLINS